MPRSAKDSDDDCEQKTATGRMQTRMFTVQSAVNSMNSPLRRSSRIKQNKYSPGSESDSSNISSTQTRSIRPRTATIDSSVSDTMKKLRTRKHSVSSEISEIDIDIPQTPGKRTTRQSSDANLVVTPTRVNTRATSKRFMRAGSETKSPLPAARTIRKTRASSIDPESLSDQNKNQSDLPIKTHRRISVLPLGSQVKEQIELENRIPYIRLDSTIIEADEITSLGNSDSSDKAVKLLQKINRKFQYINKDKVEDYTDEEVAISIDSAKSDEAIQLSEKEDQTQTENMNRATIKNTENVLDEGQNKFEEAPISDNNTIEEFSTYSSSSPNRNSTKEDKIKIVDSFSNIEKSLLNICESTKELGVMPENLSDTSVEEKKSNKEYQMQNIIGDMLVEKSVQPKMTSFVKSLASPLMNKSLSEKETKSMKVELNFSKKRLSSESVKIAVKHSNLSKEITDSFQEKMNISIESVSSTGETVLLHDNIEAVDKVINNDETSIKSTYADATEVINELDNINKKECTVTDNINFNKIELNEVHKISCLPMSLAKSIQISDSRESFASVVTTDDNEIKLMLEERNPRQDDEISSNVAYIESDQVIDLQISPPINNSADLATIADKQSALIQDKIIIIDNFNYIEQKQKNLSRHITESTFESSSTILETSNSARDDPNTTVIQDNKSSNIIEISKKSTMNISSEKIDTKDISSEKVEKENLKRKSIDNLENEKKGSQMETSRKDQENMDVVDNVSDVNAGIDLFQDIPADQWKEKNDIKIDAMQSTLLSVEEVENENEAECDLILVDKRAWLAAETIKAVKEAEPFEYDSDDTVLLKSRLDASQANKSTIEDKELSIDSKENEKRRSRIKNRLVSEIDEDSSRCTEDEDNFIIVDKSLSESKTALNRTNDQFVSKLNKSQLAKTRYSEANNESDEEIEDDANEANRSLLISKNNISLRKSIREKTSLNKSLKDMSMQNISINKSRIDNSEEEIDDTAARTKKKLYMKKYSLNKSCNEDADDNASVFEKKTILTVKSDSNKKDENISFNYSMNQELELSTRKTTHLNDDESDNNDINIAVDLGSKTSSMITNMSSGNNDQGSDQDECNILSFLFTKANSGSHIDDSSSNSDINKEYKLDGVESKFSDDDVVVDECRTSEAEFSDSDDNGSDLADFIVDDTEIDEEEDEDNEDGEENNEDVQNMKEDNEVVQKEDTEDEEKQAHIDMKLINMENGNEEDEDKDVQEKDITDKEKDMNKNKFTEMETIVISSYSNISHKLPKIHKSKNKSVEHISPHTSETEIKQDIKMKKSNTKKNGKTFLLVSSNSDLPIKKKKKSFMTENKIILSETSNLISSSLKKKKKKILKSQYSSRNGALSRDGSIQKCSQKKREKRERQGSSNENMIDEILSEDVIKLDVPKKKKVKLTQLTTVENNTREYAWQKKNQDTSKKNITGEVLSEDKIKLNISEIKKPIKLTQLTIVGSNIHENVCQVNKQKKKQNTLKENITDEALSKGVIELKIPKKKKQIKLIQSLPIVENSTREDVYQINERKKKQDILKEIIARVLSEDKIELKIPKKKKHGNFAQLHIIEDNTHEDEHQINKRKKKKKNQDTSRENIDKVLSQNVLKLKIPKKKKYTKLIQLPIVENNIRQDMCQINEKEKKQKKTNNTREYRQ